MLATMDDHLAGLLGIEHEVGQCNRCRLDGSGSRLAVHHIDRNKRYQAADNLEVLCHRCHMREHTEKKEVGWARYHEQKAS